MKLLEVKRKVLVIYPGGFHPFHLGHASVYQRLVQEFPGADVYIAASDTTTERPFSFEEKQFLATQAGVPQGRFVLVKSPYQSREITANYDADNTVLIFATSQKDSERFKYQPKKDGSPSYFQPFADIDASKPMSQHGYIYVAPVKKFTAAGQVVDSASKLRDMYVNGTDAVKQQIIQDLYPKSRRHSHIQQIMDRVLLGESLTEEFIAEVSMSPKELLRWANTPAAQGIRVGVEYELIFPDVKDAGDSEFEPDWDADQRAYDIDGIIEFFRGGESGLSSRGADRLAEQLSEQFADWITDSFDSSYFDMNRFNDWAKENLWPEVDDEYREQARENLDDPEASDEAIEKEALALFWDDVERDWDRSGDWYDRARDELYEEYSNDVDPADWLSDSGLRFMSDVSNEFSLDWPYWTEVSNDADVDWQRWAEEIADVVDMPVMVGRGYHSTRRGEDRWIMEPDSSLDASNDDDAGMELISPPLPLPEALEMMQRIAAWAQRRGVYTNSTTGLHMNISLPVSEVDYVKLVLFMGDQYILDLFGRAANSYTRSAFGKIQDKARYSRTSTKEAVRQSRPGVYSGDVDIAAAMKLMRTNLIELAGRYLQGGVGGDKYTSAHVKQAGNGTYVEFRSPGNDWLDDDVTVNQALTTMLRFARAMTIAGDPSAERREYAKKMYKLLSGYKSTEISRSGQDGKYKTRVEYEGDEKTIDQLFAKYATGLITGQELKKEWAERVLSQKPEQDSDEDSSTATQYEIFNQATGKVIDVVRANTDQDALDLANTKYSGQGINYGVRRKAAVKKPASPRAALAQRVTRSTQDVGDQLWRVNHHSSVQWVVARSQAEAIEKAIKQDRMFNSSETRARIATDLEKNQYEWDQQREIERRQRWSTNQPQGEWTGRWLIKNPDGITIHVFQGNNQADANRYAANWLRQNPRRMQTGVEVVPEMR
jgi:hypothetical protein